MSFRPTEKMQHLYASTWVQSPPKWRFPECFRLALHLQMSVPQMPKYRCFPTVEDNRLLSVHLKCNPITVVNDLRIRPQMAKFILTKWPHGSSLHTYRVPPGPLDQPWCTPIVSYSNRYTPTPELLGSLLLFWQAIFKLPLLLCYLMYLNVWWCKLTLTYRAK